MAAALLGPQYSQVAAGMVYTTPMAALQQGTADASASEVLRMFWMVVENHDEAVNRAALHTETALYTAS